MAQPNVYDELADRLRGLAREKAREASPPVERGKVVAADPLVLDLIGSDVVLEEGDPDVEIAKPLLVDRPDVGDTVRVHVDGDGDYILSGVIE